MAVNQGNFLFQRKGSSSTWNCFNKCCRNRLCHMLKLKRWLESWYLWSVRCFLGCGIQDIRMQLCFIQKFGLTLEKLSKISQNKDVTTVERRILHVDKFLAGKQRSPLGKKKLISKFLQTYQRMHPVDHLLV